MVENAHEFHRVDPRLRVLKGLLDSTIVSISWLVSSRRPEVEGTERERDRLGGRTSSSFHRVDPRLRVLKVYDGGVYYYGGYPFHRVDPRLRVLKAAEATEQARHAMVGFIA